MNFDLTPEYPYFTGTSGYFEYRIKLSHSTELDDDGESRYLLNLEYRPINIGEWKPFRVEYQSFYLNVGTSKKVKIKTGWFSSKHVWSENTAESVARYADEMSKELSAWSDNEDNRKIAFNQAVADLTPVPVTASAE